MLNALTLQFMLTRIVLKMDLKRLTCGATSSRISPCLLRQESAVKQMFITGIEAYFLFYKES